MHDRSPSYSYSPQNYVHHPSPVRVVSANHDQRQLGSLAEHHRVRSFPDSRSAPTLPQRMVSPAVPRIPNPMVTSPLMSSPITFSAPPPERTWLRTDMKPEIWEPRRIPPQQPLIPFAWKQDRAQRTNSPSNSSKPLPSRVRQLFVTRQVSVEIRPAQMKSISTQAPWPKSEGFLREGVAWRRGEIPSQSIADSPSPANSPGRNVTSIDTLDVSSEVLSEVQLRPERPRDSDDSLDILTKWKKEVERMYRRSSNSPLDCSSKSRPRVQHPISQALLLDADETSSRCGGEWGPIELSPAGIPESFKAEACDSDEGSARHSDVCESSAPALIMSVNGKPKLSERQLVVGAFDGASSTGDPSTDDGPSSTKLPPQRPRSVPLLDLSRAHYVKSILVKHIEKEAQQ